jgi:hypothetical protein
MTLDIAAVGPGEQDALAGFLARAFSVSRDAAFLRPEFLAWKYFQSRPDWDAPRSWALNRAGEIVAHAGIWPLRFRLPGRTVPSMHIIDWAGAPEAPGAGAMVYREVLRQTGLLFGVGGSGQARKVIRRIGLQEIGALRNYVRVIRPWKQFRTRPETTWKTAAKLARNTAWRLARSGARGGWTAVRVSRFPETLSGILAADRSDWVFGERTPGLLNYVLSCPANCRGFVLMHNGEARGHLLLSRMGGQSRIADLWVASEQEADWTAAYTTAIGAAEEDPDCCELAAGCSDVLTRTALEASGFHFYNEKPLWLFDPAGQLANAPPLHVQGLESDGFFLHDPQNPYLT